ncbi:MAG: hypothetical protein AB9866_13170 [Syntrophobacteraceae bacterium]
MSFSQEDDYTFTGPLKPRVSGGVTFIGPDFFAEDEYGNLLSPIASVFPKFRTIITVRGIHACHASMMIEFLRQEYSKRDPGDLQHLESEIYQDAVALLLRSPLILVRSDPADMERVFAADEILQSFLPKERIQFTGLHIPDVRKKLRLRGESWRISPPPKSIPEICQYIRSSKLQVITGLKVYYNAPTGGRFLTYNEFMRIRPMLKDDPTEALARLKEMLNLFRRVNNRGSRELSFFLPAGQELHFDGLRELILFLEGIPEKGIPENGQTAEAEDRFDRFAAQFANAAGPELVIDDENNPVWRTTMFCRLYDINEQEMEEWSLGLSTEFHLNVKWLPGATVVSGELRFDAVAARRVQGLISHFWKKTGGFISINVGHVEASQTRRDISGEERDVYLVVMTTSDGQETIRLVRLMKWDVIHRFKMGIPLDQAIEETIYYRNYIFDRLRAAAQLGFPILEYDEIRLDEELPGLGKVPAFFFDRQYVTGIVTDKIPISFYKDREFITALAPLLGIAAAFTLVLGRVSPRTGKIFYDDGDELIQFDYNALPNRLVIIETTGSFTDWTTPLVRLLPQCLSRFRLHLDKALDARVSLRVIHLSISLFAEALLNKIRETKRIAGPPHYAVHHLFQAKDPESGGIRHRWEGILARLAATDLSELENYIRTSPELDIKSE